MNETDGTHHQPCRRRVLPAVAFPPAHPRRNETHETNETHRASQDAEQWQRLTELAGRDLTPDAVSEAADVAIGSASDGSPGVFLQKQSLVVNVRRRTEQAHRCLFRLRAFSHLVIH